MTMLRFTVVALFGLIGVVQAGPCEQARLDVLTTEAMSQNEAARSQGYTEFNTCYKQAKAAEATGALIDEGTFSFLATLAGRLASASYAVNEPPQTTPVVAQLMNSHFDQFYYYLQAQPMGENSAVMRALVQQGSELLTGSIKK